MRIFVARMARAATTLDAFNAIAEPKRRTILDELTGGELPVKDLVGRLGMTQPQVSKHLRVLREVGLVSTREEGRQRFYRLEGRPLKSIHDWVKEYERTWEERFSALDDVLDEMKATKEGSDDDGDHRNGGGHPPDRRADPDHPRVRRSPGARVGGVDHPRPREALVGRQARRGGHGRDRSERRRRLPLHAASRGWLRGRIPRLLPRDRAERTARLHRGVRGRARRGVGDRAGVRRARG